MQAKVTKSTIFYEQSKKYTAEGPPSSGLQPTKPLQLTLSLQQNHC